MNFLQFTWTAVLYVAAGGFWLVMACALYIAGFAVVRYFKAGNITRG